MNINKNIDKYNIASYFPKPCRVIQTRGTGDGIILKFDTYYLKIYDDYSSDKYVIEKYLYGYSNPISIDKIHVNQIREYALKCN